MFLNVKLLGHDKRDTRDASQCEIARSRQGRDWRFLNVKVLGQNNMFPSFTNSF